MLHKAVVLGVLLVLAGCGAREGAHPAGKLAARVNGAEITMRQLAAFQPSARVASPGQALDKVIDRELLVQQALREKLDTDPAVVELLDAARRQILAQAWLDRAAQGRLKATAQEIGAFYAENPALFGERRIYRFREISVAVPADRIDVVRAEAASARDLEEVAGWLRWRNLKVGPVTGATQPAEQLPLAYLAQLSHMKEGDIAVLAAAPGVAVVQLIQAQDAPLSEEQAAPLIEQFLSGRKKLELADAEVKRLRQAARIEYVGDFKR